MDVESVPGSILWFQTVPWPDTCADPASHLSTTIWIECGFCFQMHHSFSGNNSTLAVFYHVTSLFIGNVCCVLSPLFIMFFLFLFISLLLSACAIQRTDSPPVGRMILSVGLSCFIFFLPPFRAVFQPEWRRHYRLAIWIRATHNGETSAV